MSRSKMVETRAFCVHSLSAITYDGTRERFYLVEGSALECFLLPVMQWDELLLVPSDISSLDILAIKDYTWYDDAIWVDLWDSDLTADVKNAVQNAVSSLPEYDDCLLEWIGYRKTL